MTEVQKDDGVICSLCGIKFDNNGIYLDHVCDTTGYTPRDQEHYGSLFMTQSKKALERTGSLTQAIKKKIDDKIKKIKGENIDDKIMRSKIK